MQTVNASPAKPFLVWDYKGKTYATNVVKVIPSSSLRHEQRKFWLSCIKPSMETEKRGARLTKYKGKVCRQKEVYYCPIPQVLDMIHNNLKMSVRVKPFNASSVDKFLTYTR